jgi:Rrf2 family protein
VSSRRGPGGGFSLARAPGKITVSEVLRVTDGPISLAPCAGGGCVRDSVCVTRRLWDRAGKALDEIFGAATIGGLAEEARNLGRASAYHI